MEEISNWKDHKVFEEVVDEDQNTVSVRWVTTKKNKDDEPVYKACLFIRGFEETEKDEIRKNSTTCCKENFGLILSSAFLQGHPISCDIFVKSP